MVIDDVNNKISPFLWLKAFYQNSHALHPLRHTKLQNFLILLESLEGLVVTGGDGFQVFSDVEIVLKTISFNCLFTVI